MRILLAVGAVLALTITGCGSSPTGNGVASVGGGAVSGSAPTSAVMSLEDSSRQFAQCMRDHGVDMPDPDPSGKPGNMADVDRNSPAFTKGMEACKSLLPGGGDLSKLDPKMIDQLRQFTQCLRDHGLDVPDPDPNSPMLGLDQMQNLDRDNPAVQKAFDACKDKIPGRPGQ
jgi:hypothetical protein